MPIAETDIATVDAAVQIATNEQLTPNELPEKPNPSNPVPLTKVMVDTVIAAWKDNWPPTGNRTEWRRNYVPVPATPNLHLSRDQVNLIVTKAIAEAKTRGLILNGMTAEPLPK